ncbi:MAG TPA: hypothetical protein VGC79_09120 [Polyangiaceae bacterium]
MRTLAGFVGLGLLCFGCSSSDGGGAADPQGSAGSGGGGAAQPSSSNVFVDQIAASVANKVDVLFMIDNSPSMADKQEILEAAVPVLLKRLLSPLCLDKNGERTGSAVNADGTCPVAGSTPEFAPIGDIHIGIVSSSLGAHGGSSCSAQTGPELDDRAHLIGTQRSGLTSWQNAGFLAWDPRGIANTPPGESDPTKLVADFTAMIKATGEHGCGYEASLESWYRFLIDPEPPASVSQVGGVTVRQGIDSELLAQRAAFLRPDSLLAIVMLSDENDCSIRDDGQGWMVSSTARMPMSTAACSLNPNDPCCRSCSTAESSPPAGCQALSADSSCKGDSANPSGTWDELHDSLNLRCYRQQARFGLDLLYPTARYVEGLTKPTLTLPSDPNQTVPNPLFAGQNGQPGRARLQVFLAGIVGVPWQDIATAESLTSPVLLEYLTSSELAAQGRWQQLVGDPSASPPRQPSDPFMIESPAARVGSNPNLPSQIVPVNSTNPKANAINGHERNIPKYDDLQYACTFPLITPKQCPSGDALCDCAPGKDGSTNELIATNSPLCQPPGGGVPGTTQYFAKAYPGTRQLTVLKDLGQNAIAASICPKITTATGSPSSDPNYGYNPAIGAIIDRLRDALHAPCLSRPIVTGPDANGGPVQAIGCNVIEVQKSNVCDCTQPGRSPAPSALGPALFNSLQNSGNCGNSAGQSACDAANFCLCQIHQETGEDLSSCVANAPTNTPGFCYIDDSTSSALRGCEPNRQQLLRFIGQGDAKIPADGALLFLACKGSALAP